MIPTVVSAILLRPKVRGLSSLPCVTVTQRNTTHMAVLFIEKNIYLIPCEILRYLCLSILLIPLINFSVLIKQVQQKSPFQVQQLIQRIHMKLIDVRLVWRGHSSVIGRKLNGKIQPQYGGRGTQFNENNIPTYSLPFIVEDAPSNTASIAIVLVSAFPYLRSKSIPHEADSPQMTSFEQSQNLSALSTAPGLWQ